MVIAWHQSIIKSADDLEYVLKSLSYDDAKVKTVCRGMQRQIPAIIKSGEDLMRLLKYLPSEQITLPGEASFNSTHYSVT